MEELKIIYLPPGELTPYEHNAKVHPDKQIEHIANSIREFGFKQPIVIDDNNVIVIGHGRQLAAQRLGLDAVPCVRVDDLTAEQIRALRLADNKTNESEWDFAELESELAELEIDFDMSEFGFKDENELPPIPDNLDAEEEYNEEAPLSVKLTFPNYTAYSMYEREIKETAERMGATFALVKA